MLPNTRCRRGSRPRRLRRPVLRRPVLRRPVLKRPLFRRPSLRIPRPPRCRRQPRVGVMSSSREDLIELFEYVWQRFTDRMDGLTDAEWLWEPLADDRVTLRWRMQHIVEFLRAEPNGELPAPADSAAAAMWDLNAAFAQWRGQLDETTDESLGELIGPVAGRYGDAPR